MKFEKYQLNVVCKFKQTNLDQSFEFFQLSLTIYTLKMNRIVQKKFLVPSYLIDNEMGVFRSLKFVFMSHNLFFERSMTELPKLPS